LFRVQRVSFLLSLSSFSLPSSYYYPTPVPDILLA
jgi:hypothetical protein